MVKLLFSGLFLLTNAFFGGYSSPQNRTVGTVPEPSVQDTLQHDGQPRTYWVHIPPAYKKSDKEMSLVIALHGGGGSGPQFESQSKLSEKADKEGFIVVYPDGMQNPGVLRLRTWNAGTCCGQVAATRQADDVGFIRKLIVKLTTTYRIDPKKVYATGHSNGGMLCYRLACELSDKVAAIAANSGTMQLQTPCQPKRVMSIMHVHSQLDRNVPYMGGVGTRSINKQWNGPVDSTLNVFAQLANCTVRKQIVRTTDTYTLYNWSGCKGGTETLYYLTTDGGHSWPGGVKGARFVGDAPSNAFVNDDVIWDFFKAHSLP